MISTFRSVWATIITPILQRPPALQLAALCHRKTPDGREVLLITSSHGRWILPKGWPINGKSGGETAMQEAWEEAGVKKGKVAKTPLATFMTRKRYNDGRTLPCETTVYEIEVTKVANDYPEADKRDRRWVSPDEAAKLVDDDGLRGILKSF